MRGRPKQWKLRCFNKHPRFDIRTAALTVTLQIPPCTPPAIEGHRTEATEARVVHLRKPRFSFLRHTALLS